jgi:putative endonuclease
VSRDSLQLGALGEWIAREHLEQRGYRIVEANFRTRWGELDLVAMNDDCLVFCEVKTRLRRTSDGPFGPLTAVGAAKRRKVRRMAREWLAARPPPHRRPPALRFDALGVTLGPRGQLVELQHVEGAF